MANPLRDEKKLPQKSHKQKSEHLKGWEWREFMGVNSPTYRRYRRIASKKSASSEECIRGKNKGWIKKNG